LEATFNWQAMVEQLEEKVAEVAVLGRVELIYGQIQP
jgi:hypothetical protein